MPQDNPLNRSYTNVFINRLRSTFKCTNSFSYLYKKYMVGSAFIVHKNGWCCSNSTNLDIYNEPVIGPNGQIESIKQMRSLMAESSFNTLPEVDSECEFIFKPDAVGAVVSFKGRVRIVKPTLIINILSPIEDHKYIIDSIKNNIGI